MKIVIHKTKKEEVVVKTNKGRVGRKKAYFGMVLCRRKGEFGWFTLWSHIGLIARLTVEDALQDAFIEAKKYNYGN